MVELKKHGNIHHKMEVQFVMTNGHPKHFHNGTCCKDKWRFIYGNYKKIIDYISITNHNEDYLEMSIENRATQGLPRSFSRTYFDLIDEFMHSRPCFNIPHSLDSICDIYLHNYTYKSLHHMMTLTSMIKDDIKRNASPIASLDPILQCT
jgi:hypothetical protein